MKKVEFTKELKADWVAALKSGNFKKGIGQLREKTPDQENKYCCLGVLACVCPRMEITTGGYGVHLDGGIYDEGYKIFEQMFGIEKVKDLYQTNDNTSAADAFASVIPIIED